MSQASSSDSTYSRVFDHTVNSTLEFKEYCLVICSFSSLENVIQVWMCSLQCSVFRNCAFTGIAFHWHSQEGGFGGLGPSLKLFTFACAYIHVHIEMHAQTYPPPPEKNFWLHYCHLCIIHSLARVFSLLMVTAMRWF